MALRLSVILPRVFAIAVVALLATATMTFAAETRSGPAVAAAAPSTAKPILLVPDVRGQAYVFAKSTLEDGGFAWRVTGSVQGYAANLVASQSPAPGSRVYDTGAPTITLGLKTNTSYPQSGSPENVSSFPGTVIQRVGVVTKPKAKPKPGKAKAEGEAEAGCEAEAEGQAAKPKPKPKPKPERPPAFIVAGAKPEPLDEIPLTARARRLDRWLSSHRSLSDRERQLLALPARLDRHRREVRLVARSRGARPADRGRPARPALLGNRKPQRARRPRSARGGPNEVTMSMLRRFRRRSPDRPATRCSSSLMVLAILGTVVGALTTLFVQATNAEFESNRRFQAQQGARIAIDKMRREIHCSSAVTPVGATSSISVTVPSQCVSVCPLTPPTCAAGGAPVTVTYDMSGSGTRYQLRRNGVNLADYVTLQNVFNYTAPVRRGEPRQAEGHAADQHEADQRQGMAARRGHGPPQYDPLAIP